MEGWCVVGCMLKGVTRRLQVVGREAVVASGVLWVDEDVLREVAEHQSEPGLGSGG